MNYNYLKEKVFEVLKFNYNGDIEFVSHDGMICSLKDGKATVGGCSEAAVCRALTEFAKAVTEGKTNFNISKNPHFEWCGAMLDMSRNGVMNKNAVKRYLDLMACFGMNMLMLYTEDVFELKKYPFFGYKRGRYTLDELGEIDDYAHKLGIEIIPCVQTLGHLDSYLHLKEASPIRDTKFSLMPDNDKSYEFIEEIVKTMRKVFRSDNIHIGMDEVTELGKGAYFDAHRGEVINQEELMINHLIRVCDICKKYGYNPIMWSDLLFTDEDTRRVYSYKSKISDKVKPILPDVRLMFWYYSGRVKDRYKTLLDSHLDSGKPIAFAGGGWNWEAFVSNYKFTFECMVPALDACIETNAQMLLNTLWGNGGCENSYFMNFPSNALFAEYQWCGEEANVQNVWDLCEFVTGLPKDVYDTIDKANFDLDGCICFSRKLLRQDVFDTIRVTEGYLPDNLPDVFTDTEPMATFRAAAGWLREYIAQNGDWNEYCELSAQVLETMGYKAEIFAFLRKAYQSGDKTELTRILNDVLPACKESYSNLYKIFFKQWQREYKAFGWEVHCQRLGFQLERISYACEMLQKYLDGDINKIEELEEKQMNQNVIEKDVYMYEQEVYVMRKQLF